MNATATLPNPGPLPAPPLLTAEEFAERYAGDRTELIDGVVRELPMAMPKHGKMCYRASQLVGRFVEDNDLGHMMTNDSFVKTQRDPDRVRGADVCFYSYGRLPRGEVPNGILPSVPDLVVEVRSPSDTWTEVFAKVVEYLSADVRVVVVIDDDSKTASIYRGNAIQQTLKIHEILEIPDVLPGFSVPVEKFFS